MKFFRLLLFFSLFPLHLFSSSVIHLGVEQGLSNNHVVSITQDKAGFLWFATEEGLNRFDGNGFSLYNKHNSHLSGNDLNYILSDPVEPVIWIATQRDGFNAYNYENDSIEVFRHNENDNNSLITDDVTAIAHSADGNLWLSTYHCGVEYFDKKNKSFTHYNSETVQGLPSNNTWFVMDDQEGKLYIGHVNHGLSVMSIGNKMVENFQHDPNNPSSIPSNEVRRIYKDSHNNIWIGTSKGLVLFNVDEGVFIQPDQSPESPLNSSILAIQQTKDNKLWVATELSGVYVLDLKQHFFTSSTPQLKMQHYTMGLHKNSLSNSSVRSIFQDSFNNIWLATYGGGINFIGHASPLFDKYGYSPFPDDPYSMNNRMALSLALDKDNKLWIGTDGGGINIFEDGERVGVCTPESHGLSHNVIQALLKDSYDNIWVGTFWKGINHYNHKTKQFSPILLEGANDQDIRCFHEDSEQRIWVGTSNGIYLLDARDRAVITHFNSENSGLPENLVRSINTDHLGRVWVGTFGRGAAVFTPDMQSIQYFNEQNGLHSNTINYIFTDSQQRVWFATGNGLACITGNDSLECRVYGREDGLINTYIRAISEDKNGNIWISSNGGIDCILFDTEEFQNWNHIGKTPMSPFLNSVIKDDKNEIIYFGSINGTYYFEPYFLLQDRKVPPPVVTEMRIYDTNSTLSEEKIIRYFEGANEKITLSHKQNTFTLFFNVQDYAMSDHVNYSYRLVGEESVWQHVNQNNVTFRSMSPGNYQFQVYTHILNQQAPGDIFTLSIRITPPIWLSWWAKALYIIAAILILTWVIISYKKRVNARSLYEMEKINLAREQELNNERLRFYTNITHELRTPLTLIIGPLEDLQNDARLEPKQQHKIGLIRQNAFQLLDLINQLLEFRKTETQNKQLQVSKGNIAVLVNEVGLKYKELNTNPNLEITIELDQEETFLFFDKEIVTTILDNLMSNAIKYSEKGKIALSLKTVDKNSISRTEIKVEDTGYGIPENELDKVFEHYYQVKDNKHISGTGIGLALVKKLAEIHEGEIHVESELGKGSSFTFSLLTHNIYPNALHYDEEPARKEIENKESLQDDIETGTLNEKPILLVVEDNHDIRDYITESFSDTFEVITASEGEEGYASAIRHAPDIIVSDIMMPGMDGIDLCKRIKEDVRTSHIPVILLTAKTTMRDKEEGYVSGADSYLTKPFSATLLRSRIENILENRKRIAEQYFENIQLDKKSDTFTESINRIDSEFINNVTELILDNLENEKIDVGFLSQSLSMSNSTLYRKIKALTGISTNEFIRKVKINRAEQLLLTGEYTISEVGYQVGMNSPVYFRQCFKEEFGMVPSDYLKMIKEAAT